jgi:hypothetical protein
MTYGPSPYDRDPQAIAWARAKVQAEIDHVERFAAELADVKDQQAAATWGAIARYMRRTLLGNPESPVMGRFDERLPALHEAAADWRPPAPTD